MMSNANGAMYGNIQGIKNLMKSYDKDGDYIDPTTGLAGLLVTEENAGSRKCIITIPESSKDEMFEQTKKEFLRENGFTVSDFMKLHSDVGELMESINAVGKCRYLNLKGSCLSYGKSCAIK